MLTIKKTSLLYNIVESMVKNNYEPLTEVISSGYEAFFKFAIKFLIKDGGIT